MLVQLLIIAAIGQVLAPYEKFVARCQEEQKKRIAAAEARLEAAEKQLEQEKKTRVSRADKGAVIAKKRAIATQENNMSKLNLKLGELKNSRQLPFPILPRDLAVGDMGMLAPRPQAVLKINQIIDESNMLVICRIGQPLNSVILPPERTVWVHGIDTSRIADGEKAAYIKPFVVTGTRRYETVTGASKTVYVLEPLDLALARNSLPQGYTFEADADND